MGKESVGQCRSLKTTRSIALFISMYCLDIEETTQISIPPIRMAIKKSGIGLPKIASRTIVIVIKIWTTNPAHDNFFIPTILSPTEYRGEKILKHIQK